MERKYYIHRISGGENAWQLGHGLLNDCNLLSIGWSYFSTKEKLSIILVEGVDAIYNREGWPLTRNRWNLWRFVKQMKKGDYVVVPGWKHFSIYEIVSDEVLCNSQLDKEYLAQKGYSIPDNHYILNQEKKSIDLGFYREVKPVKVNLPREGYALQALASRMKIRQTNALLPSEIAKEVDEALKAEAPFNLKEAILEVATEPVLAQIRRIADCDKFENLVEWYLKRIGANEVITPAKNSSTTEEGDADKVAIFNHLKLQIQVQVKKHDGVTNNWAVEQIANYNENKEVTDDISAVIMWVISSADNFTDDAKQIAAQKEIRLINGADFARMIIETGVSDLPF